MHLECEDLNVNSTFSCMNFSGKTMIILMSIIQYTLKCMLHKSFDNNKLFRHVITTVAERVRN